MDKRALPHTRELLGRFGRLFTSSLPREQNLAVLRLLVVLILFATLAWFNLGNLQTLALRMLLGLFGLVAAVGACVLYVQDAYGLGPVDARTRLRAAIALGRPPGLVLEKGATRVEDPAHPLVVIGGPGRLRVPNDAAVVLDRLGLFSRVIGTGTHTLESFERIFAVVNLRPLTDKRKLRTWTRDGIPVEANSEIEFRIAPWTGHAAPALPAATLFRLAVGEIIGRKRPQPVGDPDLREAQPLPPKNRAERAPYPFNERHVKRAAYAQSIARSASGEPVRFTWAEGVPELQMSALKNALSRMTYDRLTEPESIDPQESLAREQTPRWQIQNSAHRDAFESARTQFGCVITRFSIGRIGLDSDIAKAEPALRQALEEQRVKVWEAQKRRPIQFPQERATWRAPGPRAEKVAGDSLAFLPIEEIATAGSSAGDSRKPNQYAQVRILEIEGRPYHLRNLFEEGKALRFSPFHDYLVTCVEGHNMDLEDIDDGDYVLYEKPVNTDYQPQEGDLVVARILDPNGRRGVVRRYRRSGAQVVLESICSDPNQKDVFLEPEDVEFLGQVVAVLKRQDEEI